MDSNNLIEKYCEVLNGMEKMPARAFSADESVSGFKAAYNVVSTAVDKFLDEDDDALSFITNAQAFCINWAPCPTTGELIDDLKWFKSRLWKWSDAPLVEAKKKRSAIEEYMIQLPTIDDDATVTQSGAAAFRLRGEPKLTKMLEFMSMDLAQLTVSEVTGLFVKLIHTLKTLPDKSMFGEHQNISEEQYHAWELSNSKDTQAFAPYMFMKALLQGGANWEYYEDLMGTPYLLMERNGVKAFATSKHTIDLENSDQGSVVQEHEYTMICKGIVDHGKQIRLERVPAATYNVANMILFRHDVRVNEKALVITARQTPVSYGKEFNPIIDHLAAEILADDTRPGKDADEIIDWIVRLLHRKYRKQTEILIDVYKRIEATTEEFVNDFVGVCKSKADEKDEAKFAFLAKSGVINDVQGAINALDAARKIRNRPICAQVSQYIQKGVASIYAPNMMPMFDTHIKMKKIVEQLNALVPAQWDEYDVQVYGVAYDHMGNGIEGLDRHGKVTYYDIEKAKNANTVFEMGDVFNIRVGDRPTVIIDDTKTANVPAEQKYRYPQVHNGSLFKLMCIIQARPQIIATKMSLDAFLAEESMVNLLANTGYKFVSIAKYGKLHNEEVFVILSRFGPRVRNKLSMLRGDLKVIANAIQVANKIIMIADGRGVVLDLKPSVWRDVLGILPMNWTWYKTPSTSDTSYKGVSGKAIHADKNVEIEYDNGKYDDGDGADIVLPENCLFDLSGCQDMECLKGLVETKVFEEAYVEGVYVIEGKKKLGNVVMVGGKKFNVVREFMFDKYKKRRASNDFIATYIINKSLGEAAKGPIGKKMDNWRKNKYN